MRPHPSFPISGFGKSDECGGMARGTRHGVLVGAQTSSAVCWQVL